MPFSSHTHSLQVKQLFQLPLQPQEIGCYSSLGNPLNVVNELQTVGSQVHSTERVPTHLQVAKNLRYTVPNAETTAGGFCIPVGDSVKLSDLGLAAIFSPNPFHGRARWGVARPARVASSMQTHLVPPTRFASVGRFVKRTERRHAMAIKAKSLATPTHFFYPKFKKGDICRLKRCTAYPELNGLTVTLQSNLVATKNRSNQAEYWVGYEVDLVYKGNAFCMQEDQLTKIGEVEL